MEKVGLAGVLLLSQVGKEHVQFECISKVQQPVLYPYLQAKWCTGCHNYVNVVKEEEKCMRNILLESREKAGEFILNEN